MNWKTLLEIEQQEDYFLDIRKALARDHKRTVVCPPKELIFSAFKLTLFDKLKVVIIGKEPIDNESSDGLAWSEPNPIDNIFGKNEISMSLANVFKELESDIGNRSIDSGDLSGWAKQGVLLLNTTLTVNKGKPESHAEIGWNTFTDNIIKQIAHHKKHVMFILWGKSVKNKKSLIKFGRYGSDNRVLLAAHPSPFSAKKGFFGCKHFSKANEYLISKGLEPIDWLKTS